MLYKQGVLGGERERQRGRQGSITDLVPVIVHYDWGQRRPRISVYPATSGRETLETMLALLGAGYSTRLDSGIQIEQVFKIGHERLKSSLKPWSNGA